MSSRRRLRRLAAKAKLSAQYLDPRAAKHGCAACRDQANRQTLVKQLITANELGPVKARCPICGADWLVSFFADATGQANVRFEVMPAEVPS